MTNDPDVPSCRACERIFIEADAQDQSLCYDCHKDAKRERAEKREADRTERHVRVARRNAAKLRRFERSCR